MECIKLQHMGYDIATKYVRPATVSSETHQDVRIKREVEQEPSDIDDGYRTTSQSEHRRQPKKG